MMDSVPYPLTGADVSAVVCEHIAELMAHGVTLTKQFSFFPGCNSGTLMLGGRLDL